MHQYESTKTSFKFGNFIRFPVLFSYCPVSGHSFYGPYLQRKRLKRNENQKEKIMKCNGNINYKVTVIVVIDQIEEVAKNTSIELLQCLPCHSFVYWTRPMEKCRG